MLAETIWYSDVENRDNLPVMDPDNKMSHPISTHQSSTDWNGLHIFKARVMTLEFTQGQCENFEIRISPDLQRKERRYYFIQYEVRLVLKNIHLTYEFVVPKSGKWPEHNVRDYGEDPIVAHVELEDGGVYNLYNSV